MQIDVIRKWLTDQSTIGELYVDGALICFTLEDAAREPGIKIKGQTAIPAGTYQVIIDFSNRFQRRLPHLLDVPMYEGIRIHAGNSAADTEGCILVGMGKATDWVSRSRDALAKLQPMIQDALDDGDEVWITISSDVAR